MLAEVVKAPLPFGPWPFYRAPDWTGLLIVLVLLVVFLGGLAWLSRALTRPRRWR